MEFTLIQYLLIIKFIIQLLNNQAVYFNDNHLLWLGFYLDNKAELTLSDNNIVDSNSFQ